MRYLILILTAAGCCGQTQFVSGNSASSVWPTSAMSASTTATGSTTYAVDSDSKKLSACGHISISGAPASAKTISTVTFSPAAVTKSNGSTFKVSAQTMDTTAGPVVRPTGTILDSGTATVTISNANFPAAFAWHTTGAMTTSATWSHGSTGCLVFEFESFVAGDSFNIGGTVFPSVAYFPNFGQSARYDGSTWGAVQYNLLAYVTFTDGSIGTIGNPFPGWGSTINVNTGTSPDEVGLKFTPNFAFRITGICAQGLSFGITSDYELVLYEGTTAIATATFDSNNQYTTGSTGVNCGTFTPYHVTAGTTYYAAVKPTTANSVYVRFYTASSTDSWATTDFGSGTSYSSRTDDGAWSDITARRPAIAIMYDAITPASSVNTGGSFVVAQ